VLIGPLKRQRGTRLSTPIQFDPAKFDRALAVRGLDLGTLASLAELNRSTISRARRGKKIRRQTLQKLARTFADVPPLAGVEDLLA